MNSGNLKAIIVKNGDTQEKLANFLGLQVSGLNARINGKIEFRRSEIDAIGTRYNLSGNELMEIFFNKEVS